MKTRILAAIVGLAIVLPLIIWGGVWGTTGLVFFAMLVCFDEYSRMAFPEDQKVAFAWQVLLGFSVAAVGLYLEPRFQGIALGGLAVATFIFVTLRPGEHMNRAADRLGRHFIGAAWIGGLFPFLIHIRTSSDQGVILVILALALSWLGDTGAYFAGRAFGKAKLYERISPKKTWAGFWGGVVASTLGVLACCHFWVPEVSDGEAIILGCIGSCLGVLGDLAESLLKRSFGIKDSGWIMPGHGGLLDRIDSVLFVAPWFYAFLVMIE